MLLRSIRSRLLGLVVATVVPFAALIGAGLWNQWRNDQAAGLQRALHEARLLAVQVDDHIGNLENLMIGLSRAVSMNPADTLANDALLRKVKSELPDFISNVVVYGRDGITVGTSLPPEQQRPNFASNRAYFQEILAGKRLAIGDVIRARPSGQWVLILARPVEDQSGQLQGVMAIGTRLEHFQDALRVRGLPPGGVVRIVNEKGVVVAQSVNGPNWIGRDVSGSGAVARHLAAKEASEITLWSDDVKRITGSATAHTVPWLVSVGLPTDAAFAAVMAKFGWGALFIAATLLVAFTIAWMLSGRIVRPLRQLRDDASTLAAGKLSHRSTVGPGDELGVLAGAFNRMAESLEQREREARQATEDLRQAKDALAAVIDASPVAIVCSDPQHRIFLWSRAAEQIFGYTAEEALSRRITLVPPEGAQESRELFERAMNGEIIRDVHVKRMRKDGTLVDVRIAAARMHNPDGTMRGVARAYEDITERKRAERQLERIAHYDQLTGLPNRLMLQKELGRLLAGADSRPTAIAVFDLDGFKDVNDTLGHSTGDHLLIEVGARLTGVTGRRGTVCRHGGDEFVVILPECGDPLVIGGIVDAMLRQLAEPFTINDQVLHIGGSAGVAIAPADAASADDLIANADLALYQAKADGGRTYRFFLPALRARAQARRSLDLDLRRAFAENEFELYFQPQIRLADDAVVGAEALLRWRHPTQGVLAPGVFIDALADSAIAPDVGRWIILAACEKAALWRSRGCPLARIGVNLFPPQSYNKTILADIEAALRDSGLPAEMLELEITENAALNYEDAAVSLQKLYERGVKLAFDDFGTGYASLSYLTQFPLSRIKIDRSFVSKITDDAGDAAIVRSLIAMAHNLGLEVIAEGVETSAQVQFLLNERCEEAQGYFYAKPLPAADFEAYLKTKRLAMHMQDLPPTREAKFRRRATRLPPRRRLPAG